jgi:hypothetical protein
MKKIMLAAALIAATFSAATARVLPSKAENDAAMKNGHKALVSKTYTLETSVKQHNTAAAEAAAMDILALMRKGVAQTRNDADLLTGTQSEARMKDMLKMEDMVRTYLSLVKDVSANGEKLVQQAQVFLTAY